ncbi:exodeoxyribonuclease V subunit beta [Marinobacter sp. NP-4(2019)]|uniref:exodeoxyribonuclease V subunit beta n=1 Tax=Marinobacter sp. NP-4(2019) TaxID=2488665 RepID=UPI000FC3CE57|nr:exodeoxyribonuclease V subunit beta [Marinobacter sp. NP-4(2019)]AZT82088.1 exodeoxyribonuclease V subunit beta [Marinobacter sp. NP-4(2019)]
MSNNMTNRNPNLDPLTLPLNGSTLIEASAGTGKTFTIAILYVRLVLGHDQPEDSPLAQGILPPNLLVVTFTDAATKELRDRIRTRLTQAAEVFSDAADVAAPSAETALIHQLRDDSYPDPATWPECRKKLLLAAEWMDEAAVSTIHGWCNRMLSEHAFDSGSLFKLTLETDQSDLLDEVVRDYWRTFIYPLSSVLMDEALSHWKTPDDLRKSVRNLITDADNLDAPTGDVKQAIEQTVSQRQQRARELKAYDWANWKPEVVELLTTLNKSKRLHGGSMKPMIAAWDTLLEWAASDELYPQGLDKAGFQNQTPAILPSKLKGEEPAPHHPAFEAIAELVAFSQNLPSAESDILRHASHWIAQRLESEKQKRSEMGFDDLLTRLDDALHGPRGEQLAATIRRQFPVALIDEFQDTDPVQYRIFNRVYQVADNDPHTCMLMIGDPKQAIYGFRGADIHTYLEARKGARERTYTLGRNFRSAEAMVKAVNRVFEHGDQNSRDGAFLFGKGDTSPLPFQGVDANGTRRLWSVQGEIQPSLTFWSLESDEEDKTGNRKGLAKGAATSDIAETCASEIARLLSLGQAGQAGFALAGNPSDLEPVQPKDIAILVNNRNEASAVRDALGRRQIKSVYLSDRDSVLTSPEAKEMLCWLKAFAEPRQLAYARASLATPTLGQSWQSLNRLLTDEIALEREIERFMGYQQQWQQQGVLPMLRSFLMDFEVPGRLLQRPDGERRLTDILHIAELLQQDSLQLDGEHALVHHYTQILRAADEEDEHRTLRLESDAGLVKVITVHKSKGLEYPLVFLPFGTAFRAENEKQAFVRYHDDSGQLTTVFDPTPDDVARADRERLGEDIRKLYVALTRARFATWVGVAAIDNWPLSGLGYLIGGEGEPHSVSNCLNQLANGHPAISVMPLPETTDNHYTEAAPEALGPALISTREAREEWWIASYSSIEYTGMAGTGIVFSGEVEDAETQNLLEESAQDEVEETVVPATRNHHHFPKGAGPGTFLHELLEWCTQQGFQQVVDNPAQLREQLTRRCSTRGWSEWIEPLEQWLLALIRQPFPLSRTGHQTTSLAELTTLRPELEFWFESCHVSTRAMDQLITHHTLNGADRPQVNDRSFNGMLKGFIDLVFEHDGQYYVLDYKSNTLGDNDLAYTDQAMGEAILEKRYDLQYILYLLALHRLLKARLPDYDYDTHIGGAVYLFLRGVNAPTAGAFTDKPPRTLIEQLDAMFDGNTPGEVAA